MARSTARPFEVAALDAAAPGAGTIFSVTTTGTEKVLHRFGIGHGDGTWPRAGLISINGTLYGTTYTGGSKRNDGGYGTVFSVTTTGREKVLYSFGNGSGHSSDGAYPAAPLLNVKGVLYGTTAGGACSGSGDCGTIFSVTTTGTESALYSFSGGVDGARPDAGLIEVNGTLYGTTQDGGTYGAGTVFAFAL
jgi:uncharacterized repeat protein (TIGR03803 family)